MITLRPSRERGHFDHGWLDTFHSFSFGGYRDPRQMGFRSLRVINEDRVAPGSGFGEHPHHDMEILTYILSGELQHRDSLGSGDVIRQGEWQRMTAGTGITHSEFNPSASETVHLLQIWILPNAKGHTPSYEQRALPPAGPNQWRLIASPDGRDDSLTIQQDALLQQANLTAGGTLDYRFAPGRYGWLQVARGSLQLGDQLLQAGDGAALTEETALTLRASTDADVLLFDMN
ncbi:MAG TPA: pirin family protein [Pirellulaceae bacterium]|nr:pirin family protein [Pirellulaceae bacterium]